MIICRNEDTERLSTDPRVRFLSFIGSARVGWMLRSKLAPGTRCAMEHGGAAPVIVEADADVEDAVPLLAKGGFYHAGQVCVSVQRVFVHESIMNRLAEKISLAAGQIKVGDPLSDETEVGPLISEKEVNRVDQWVQEAIQKGAKLLCGGKKISSTCYAPTVLLNPSQEARVSREEVFGPVICLYSFSQRESAIRLANSVPYSFQAAVWTKDLDRALDLAKKLHASTVMINDHTAFRVDWMPFGGRRHSGIGVGGIPYSMHEMTEEKMLVVRSSSLL